jgi:CDGSH-type Zn-finger protein
MAEHEHHSHKSHSTKFRIRVEKNGPYKVTGGLPLKEMRIKCDNNGIAVAWHEEKTYPLQESYQLCRCGRTRTPPFCDETHRVVKFDGMETAGRKTYKEQAREFKGPDLDLFDARILCTHARFCDRAGGIWKLTEKSNDNEARRTAIEEARDCPSGRLVVRDKKGHKIEPELEPSIVLVEDPFKGVSGPIWLRGGIVVEAADGTTYEVRNRVTLCRCGKSLNKPFCDGRHLEK